MLTALIWALGNLWAARTVSNVRLLAMMVVAFAAISAFASYWLHIAVGQWDPDLVLRNSIINFFGAILGGGIVATLAWRRRMDRERSRLR